MRRACLATLIGLTLGPSAAQDPTDCARFSVKGLRLGITFEEARASGRDFTGVPGFVDPSGYTRYAWQAPDVLEKVEVLVDNTVDPPQVIGLMTTIPAAHALPKETVDSLVAQWGPPSSRQGQGAFTLYTWNDAHCDVTARVSAMNVPHDVSAWILLSTTSRREQYERKTREARRAAPEAAAAPGGPSDPAPSAPEPAEPPEED